jgi:hypothetical protein
MELSIDQQRRSFEFQVIHVVQPIVNAEIRAFVKRHDITQIHRQQIGQM